MSAEELVGSRDNSVETSSTEFVDEELFGFLAAALRVDLAGGVDTTSDRDCRCFLLHPIHK